MSRLTPVTADTATPEQAKVLEGILGSRGEPSTLIDPQGGLIGPFNAMAMSPKIGRRASAMGAMVRFNEDIDRRLLEIAIITTGAHWRANFEWYAHSAMARDAGVSDDVIDAIGAGTTPPFTKDDEATVFAFAKELLDTGRVAQPTYDAARELLGEPLLVDLVSTIGYYCYISLTLNAFAVQLPAGETPMWAD